MQQLVLAVQPAVHVPCRFSHISQCLCKFGNYASHARPSKSGTGTCCTARTTHEFESVEGNARRKASSKGKEDERQGKDKEDDRSIEAEKRGPALKDNEMLSLLDTIEDHTPYGHPVWDKVNDAHVANGYHDRGGDALCRRYGEFIKKASNMPTGDGNITAFLKRTREVATKLRQWLRASDPSDEAILDGDVVEHFEGATSVVAAQVQGKEDGSMLDVSSDFDEEVAKKLSSSSSGPKQQLVIKRASGLSSAKKEKGTKTVFDAVTAIHMAQLEYQREERKERHLQNKMLMKLVGLGIAAFVNGSDRKPSNQIVRNIIATVTMDGNDNEDNDKDY